MCCGCAHHKAGHNTKPVRPQTEIPIDRMPPVMQYQGFTVSRPDDPRWITHPDEQSASDGSFRFRRLSPTHTFFAAARVRNIDISPTNSEEFKAYVDTAITNRGTELVSFQSEATTLQGQWCVRYKAKFSTKPQKKEPLTITETGFWVIHPSWDKTVVMASYSERGRPDELKGDLDPIGENFLSKIVLESAPGKKIEP
jgi:hypothetical protein